MVTSYFAAAASLVVLAVISPELLKLLTTVRPHPIHFAPLRPLDPEAQVLESVERLFEDDPSFKGPESFVFNPDGSFYTGLADGRIVQVWAPEPSATSSHCATAAATAAAGATAASEASSDASPLSSSGSTCSNIIVAEPRYEVVARTGVEVAGCGTLELEPTCGRPLGMRRLPPSKEKVGGGVELLVADAYLGILRVDTATGNVTTVVATGENHPGLALPNDLDVTADGATAFFSNTGRFPRNQIHRNLIEASPTGAVWALDVASGRAWVVASGLVMPNGVSLTHREDALLVTVMTGIVRLELPPKGPTALSRQPLPPGTILPVQMVQSDLQGTPDNIRRVTTKLRAPWSSSSSSSSPSSVTPRNENNLHQQGEVEDKHEQEGAYLVALGSERKAPFNLPQFLAPYPTLRMLASLLSLEATTALIPKAGLVVEVDSMGQVLRTLRDPTATAYWVSEAEEHGNYLYLGSWRSPFLARAKAPR